MRKLSSIQDLLGHTHVTTTERYCRVANLKVQRDYFKAMDVVMQRLQALEEDEDPRSRPREHRTYAPRRAYGPRHEKGTAPVLLMEKKWMKSENGEKGRFHEKHKER